MVQWGPGPDALFIVTMMKVHSVKPNYHTIAADMGENFTHRALGHRMDTLRNMAEKYQSTMALQANAEGNSTQASPNVPAKENKRGSSAAASNAKAKSTPTTPTKTNNEKATTKDKVTKTTPVKAKTNTGVKKRTGAVGAKAKKALKTEAKGEKGEDKMNAEGDNTDATITDGEADTQGQDGEWEADEMECA